MHGSVCVWTRVLTNEGGVCLYTVEEEKLQQLDLHCTIASVGCVSLSKKAGVYIEWKWI